MIKPFIAICALLLCTTSGAFAQVQVPSTPVITVFPETRAFFTIKNAGKDAVIAQIDLGQRTDVYKDANDGLAIIYPKTARLEPGQKQKVSVTWRGSQKRSHYYFVRVKTMRESLLKSGELETTTVAIGSAFPLSFESPTSKADVRVERKKGRLFLTNTGKRADFVRKLRLGNGREVKFSDYMLPGETQDVTEIVGPTSIIQINMRRQGWIDAKAP